MRMSSLTTEQKKQIVARYESRESAWSISRDLECQPRTVMRLLRRMGVTLRGFKEAHSIGHKSNGNGKPYRNETPRWLPTTLQLMVACLRIRCKWTETERRKRLAGSLKAVSAFVQIIKRPKERGYADSKV